MKALEVATYLTGADHFIRHYRRENALLRGETGTALSLPTDVRLSTAGRIYLERVKTMIVYPAVLVIRLTGLDLAARAVSKLLTREHPSSQG